MHIGEGSPSCIQLGKLVHHSSHHLYYLTCQSLGSHVHPPCAVNFSLHCTGVMLAVPPSRHPSLPSIPAAALGLPAYPQNLDRTGRDDNGEVISKCNQKLSKNTICLHILATSCPLPTTAVCNLHYKQIHLDWYTSRNTIFRVIYSPRLLSDYHGQSISSCLYLSGVRMPVRK